MSNLNLERGLTRCYLVLWGFWTSYLVLRAFAGPVLGGWPFKVAALVILGVVIPGLLLFALRWVGRGFRIE